MDYLKALREAGYSSSTAEIMKVMNEFRAGSALRYQLEERERLRSLISHQALELVNNDNLNVVRGIQSLGFNRTAADFLADMEASSVGRALKDIENATRHIYEWNQFKTLHDQIDNVGDLVSRYLPKDLLREHAGLYRSLAAFEETVSLRALAELKNSPFSYFDDDFLSRLRDYIPTDVDDKDEEEEEGGLPAIPEDIEKQIATTNDFNLLPERTKKFLYYLLVAIFHLMMGISVNLISEQLAEMRKSFEPAQTKAEVRAIAQRTGSAIAREVLRNYRVTFKPLNLREQPGMQGEIIVTLPIGTIVQVIDKSRRSWLLVEVEIEGEVEQGWVARRFTTILR